LTVQAGAAAAVDQLAARYKLMPTSSACCAGVVGKPLLPHGVRPLSPAQLVSTSPQLHDVCSGVARSRPGWYGIAGAVDQVAVTNVVDDQIGLGGVNTGAATAAGPPVDGWIQEVFDLLIGRRVVETAVLGEVFAGVDAVDFERVATIGPQQLGDLDLHIGYDTEATVHPLNDLAHGVDTPSRFG